MLKSLEIMRNAFIAYEARSVEQWVSLSDDIQREVDEQYMKLPVDADGVPWTIEDGEFDGMMGRAIELNMIAYSVKTGKWYLLDDNKMTHAAILCHHVKQRTVEDVLREYGDAVDRLGQANVDSGFYATQIWDVLVKELESRDTVNPGSDYDEGRG